MSKRTTLTAEGTPTTANLRNISTGTVHGSVYEGQPVCPTRASSNMEPTDAEVTCKACLKIRYVWDAKEAALLAAPVAPAQDSVAPAAPVEPAAPAQPAPATPVYTAPVIPTYEVRFTRKTDTGTEIRTVPCRDWYHAGQELGAAQAGQEHQGVDDDAVILINGKVAPPRAYWQTGPCPPWCVGPHRDSDDPSERDHQGSYLSTRLTETKPDRYGPNLKGETYTWQPRPLMACLVQHVRYAAPDIEMVLGDGDISATLTLDEAEQHAANLTELVRQGRHALVRQGRGAQTPADSHRPWCAEHHGEYCYSAPSEPGGIYLMADLLDEQPYLSFNSDGDSLQVDEAEQFALAILAQVALSRGAFK